MFSERTGWLAFGKQIRKYSLSTYVLNAFNTILDFLLYNIYLSVSVFGSTLDLLSYELTYFKWLVLLSTIIKFRYKFF